MKKCVFLAHKLFQSSLHFCSWFKTGIVLYMRLLICASCHDAASCRFCCVKAWYMCVYFQETLLPWTNAWFVRGSSLLILKC